MEAINITLLIKRHLTRAESIMDTITMLANLHGLEFCMSNTYALAMEIVDSDLARVKKLKEYREFIYEHIN